MYRRPKFLEVLLDIRQEMARRADYDVDLFVEMARSGQGASIGTKFSLVDIETANTASIKDQARKHGRKKVQKS